MTFLTLLTRILSVLSIIVLGAGIYLLISWWRLHQSVELIAPDRDDEAWRLYVGVALLAWSVLGGAPLRWLLGRPDGDRNRLRRGAGEIIPAPDGSRLHVEADGPAGAPTLVFTHGWGMDASLWVDARRRLADRYRLIFWDLPGLGRSEGPTDGRYSMDRFAAALAEVVALAGPRPVILVGHSIGGMIIQTLARNQGAGFAAKVAGVVLENTTHTDPLNTTFGAAVLRPLQPVLAGLMRLDIWLQPLVWLMSWQGYLSGSAHLAMRLGGFGTRPGRAQLDQAALLATRNSPAVQAKGNLAMMRWSATEALPQFDVPALVFVGGRDLVTKSEAGETIARVAPRARLHRVAAAGHMGPVECADTYNNALSAFADEILIRAAPAAAAAATPPSDRATGLAGSQDAPR
jgi:pimeloyl-ACP methyl ester carboxylesterase